MNRKSLLAVCFGLLLGGTVGVSCTTAQPPLECNFLPFYWAKYDLVDAGTGGSCAIYEGDRIDYQRFQVPGSSGATFAFLPRRDGRISRRNPCTNAFDGLKTRVDPEDPTYQKESPRGTYASLYADSAGTMLVALQNPAESAYRLAKVPRGDSFW